MQSPTVTVLMATCNGATFLPGQLASIAAQRDVDWRLIVSDDGSTDATRALVRRFAGHHPGRVELVPGPCRGATANFLSLLARAPAGPLALADQDDLWLPGKLARALGQLAMDGNGRPALYGCRNIRITAEGRPAGVSPLWQRGPSFANALVQNVIGGHSAVLNAEGARLLALASAGAAPAFHDWWAYLVMSGCGGRVIADPRPMLGYRQHDGNLLGARHGPGRRSRLAALRRGAFRSWFDRNAAALAAIRPLLTREARDLADRFAETRGLNGAAAVAALCRSGVHRQSRAETLVLAWAAARGLI